MTPPTNSTTDEVTLAVVASKLDGITAQMLQLSTKMDDRPTWQDVRRIEAMWEGKLDAAIDHRNVVTRGIERQITALVSWQTWAGRLVLGAVITGIISAFLVFGP